MSASDVSNMVRSPFLLLLLAVSLMLAASAFTARSAEAHTMTRNDCRFVWQRVSDVDKGRELFRACQQRALRHNRRHLCRRGQLPIVTRGVMVKGRLATAAQRRNITIALRTGRKMRSPHNHLIGVVAAMTQESGSRNIRYGHGTSVGVLQLINTHGTVAWRMRVRNSAGWFFRGARKIDPKGRMHLVSTRDSWGLIQRVQRSGHPLAYNRWVPEARHTVKRFLRGCKP